MFSTLSNLTDTQSYTMAYNLETTLSAPSGIKQQLILGHMPLFNFVF